MILAAFTALVLTACQSSSSSDSGLTQGTNVNLPVQTGVVSPSDSSSSSTTSSGQSADGTAALKPVGRLTVTGEGSSVTTDISVGKPTPNTEAQPPDEVLSACGWDSTAVLAKSVFIHGSITVHYGGKLAEEVLIDSPRLVDLRTSLQLGGGLAGGLGISAADGTWSSCGKFDTTMQPGQTITLEMWIDFGELSNSHPTYMSADGASLAIQSAAIDADQTGLGYGNVVTASGGPGAASCTLDGSSTATLLLYSALPYHYTTKDVNGAAHDGACLPK